MRRISWHTEVSSVPLMCCRPLFMLLSHVTWTGATRCCMACRRTCWGRCCLCRTLLLICSPTHGVETTSLQFCVNSIGCRYRDEWTSRLHVWHTNRLRQHHQRTYLPTFNSFVSMVDVIFAHLPTEHLLFHACDSWLLCDLQILLLTWWQRDQLFVSATLHSASAIQCYIKNNSFVKEVVM